MHSTWSSTIVTLAVAVGISAMARAQEIIHSTEPGLVCTTLTFEPIEGGEVFDADGRYISSDVLFLSDDGVSIGHWQVFDVTGFFGEVPSGAMAANPTGGLTADIIFTQPVAAVRFFFVSFDPDNTVQAFNAEDELIGMLELEEVVEWTPSDWIAAGDNVISRLHFSPLADMIVIDDLTFCFLGEANQDPVAIAGEDQEVECMSPDGADVTLDGSASFDPDDDPISFQWDAPDGVVLDDPTAAVTTGIFPMGTHEVTLTVTDGRGGVGVDFVTITVFDGAPPIVECTTDLAALWPPNHRMVPVRVFIPATDACSHPEDLVLVSVKIGSNEPDNASGSGDGNTTGDVHGQDGHAAPVDVTGEFTFNALAEQFEGTILLRAERAGDGNGRRYTIEVKVADAENNVTTATCVVVVPHDRRGK